MAKNQGPRSEESQAHRIGNYHCYREALGIKLRALSPSYVNNDGILVQACADCAVVRPVADFPSRLKPGNAGKRAPLPRCADCRRIYGRRHLKAARKWKAENPESVKSHRKALRKRLAHHPEIKAAYDASYRYRHKEAMLAKRRTPEWRAKARLYINNRYRTNVLFMIQARLRATLTQSLRLYGEGRKTESVTALIGCSVAFLVQHLEGQFLPGMSWENRSLWHIDHIRPVVSFDMTRLDGQRRCFHYSNLQPLWANDNQRKSGKWGG